MGQDEQTRKLMTLKEKVEGARSKCDRLQGQLDAEMERLEKDHGVKTVKQAEKRMAELEKSIEKGDAELGKELKKIEAEIAGMEAG